MCDICLIYIHPICLLQALARGYHSDASRSLSWQHRESMDFRLYPASAQPQSHRREYPSFASPMSIPPSSSTSMNTSQVAWPESRDISADVHLGQVSQITNANQSEKGRLHSEKVLSDRKWHSHENALAEVDWE